MIHQPWIGGLQGQTSDIEIHAREMVKTRDTIYNIISAHTGNDYEKIAPDCDRDKYMTAEEAKEYKLIDNVLEKRIIPGDQNSKEKK